MSDRRTAPDDVIIVGYYLTEARHAFAGSTDPYNGNRVAYGYAYLTSAMERVEDARAALADDLENRSMWPADGLYDLDQACNMAREIVGLEIILEIHSRPVANLIGRGHLKLAKMLSRLRYKPITDADFERVRDEYNLPGGGGGR